MRYYQVLVSSQSFHGKEALTYSSETELEIGSVVEVPLQQKRAIGFVVKEVTKPTFKTRVLVRIPFSAKLPGPLLDLLDWLIDYYPAPLGQITSLFVPSNINTKSRAKNTANESKPAAATLPRLTSDQTKAIETIQKADKTTYLLHGDTGTGKTRVYMELARETINNGKSVIVLTPEIGLTPQLVKSFSSQFPDQTFVTHSHLTAAARRDLWLQLAMRADPVILIGPRSALFSPLHSVGLIVVDECHDAAYKQEQAPHYLTSRVAAQLAHLHNAKLVLGSATPSVSDYYAFKAKKLPIIRMTQPAINNDSGNQVSIDVIPLRARDKFTKSPWLSNNLINAIGDAIDNNEQSLVFLNRRGTARIVMCQVCTWHAICPKCDLPLTYHSDNHRLRCHTCGYSEKTPSSCPVCKASDIVFKSIGTKSIVDELQRLFPHSSVARFDSDNTNEERLEKHYESIRSGKTNILVGTQMITKGLDLPNLSVVGIISADTALFFPDYTAEETTFQQLSQVIGRVGRGHRAGKIVIQTYYPENSAIKAIEDKNYSLFYKQQILEREKFLFPPFSYCLKLICARKSSSAAEKSCKNLHAFISTLPLSIEIIGPMPSFKQKQNEKYYWQLVIKSKKRANLVSIIKQLPAQISYDIDPTNLL